MDERQYLVGGDYDVTTRTQEEIDLIKRHLSATKSTDILIRLEIATEIRMRGLWNCFYCKQWCGRYEHRNCPRQEEFEEQRRRRICADCSTVYQSNPKQPLSGKYCQGCQQFRRRLYQASASLKQRAGHKVCSAEELFCMYYQQNEHCWWCGRELNKVFHVDHRIPAIRGGAHSLANLVITCPFCNQSKHDKMPHEWCGRLL